MRPLALLALVGACRPVLAPPDRDVRGDPSAAWEARLSEVVTEQGFVDYEALQADRDALDDYVAWLAVPRPHVASNPKHAYWLNAYNALVLYAMLEEGVPDSIQDIPGWMGTGPFYGVAFVVDGRRESLWEIEHERLRFRVMDPRDHAALNCASASCPPLRRELYRSRGLQQQLRDQMRRWVHDPERGVRFEDGRLVVSPVFEWFAWDFEFFTAGEDLCSWLAGFADPPLSGRLRAHGRAGCERTSFPYDWSVNRASPDRAAVGPAGSDAGAARTTGPRSEEGAPDDEHTGRSDDAP